MWHSLEEDQAYQRAFNECGGMMSANTGPYVVPIGVPIRRDQNMHGNMGGMNAGFPSGNLNKDWQENAYRPSRLPHPSHESPIANIYPSSQYAGNDDYTNFWKRMYGAGGY